MDFRGRKVVLLEGKNYIIVMTTSLIETLRYMQSLGWHLFKIEEADIWDKDLGRIEQNILYYYR